MVLAQAEKGRQVAMAEAEAESAKVRGMADAQVILAKGQAEAESIRLKRLAEAEGAKAMALAEAEGMQAKAEAYQQYNEAAVSQMLIDRLPEMAAAIAAPLAKIDRIPPELRALYATAFEIDPTWLIEAAARRQKWIDQAQSLNIYMAGASGRKLDETYKLAWQRGLKTTYYLRTLGATSAEKSTGKAGSLNAVPVAGGVGEGVLATANPLLNAGSAAQTEANFCSIDNPECEACQ